MSGYTLLHLLVSLFFLRPVHLCDPCYTPTLDRNCPAPDPLIPDHILHMSVHPHLDAFWIFDFESYYEPLPNEFEVTSYFRSNRFNSVREIFDTAYDVLSRSKSYRQAGGQGSQKAHRSFFNSEMGFFKRWFSEQNKEVKGKVKELLQTKYWQILGGGYVEHDEGCAYYQDIIENYQLGLHFLDKELGYSPRIAISADSFGHSQSTLAILAHIGVEGYFVERSDEHILLENKTQFIWQAKSANGKSYGALPTHIRWAIHGFQDQFMQSPGADLCKKKEMYIENMRRENQFLKDILKSSHIMRYFGHDFQRFNDYSYSVIEATMEKFSRESCGKVAAVYANPTQYFKILMGEVFNTVKDVQFRQSDIFPIWDYDSGLYWTGYFTTDPYHKKKYRDYGRLLAVSRKAFLPIYLADNKSLSLRNAYERLEEFAEVVAYLQHHDGISGTSKYQVLDKYEKRGDKLANIVQELVLKPMFQSEFPLGSANPLLTCGVTHECTIPQQAASGDILLKLFNSGTKVIDQTFSVKLPQGTFYQPDCQSVTLCMCYSQPCACQLHLTSPILTYSPVRLTKMSPPSDIAYLTDLSTAKNSMFSHNGTHLSIKSRDGTFHVGYKRLSGDPTPRNYAHLSRFGDKSPRSFSINSGKYALGNNIATEKSITSIRKVSIVESSTLTKVIVLWKRYGMKTIITYDHRHASNWKVETFSNAGGAKLEDLYLEVTSEIDNKQTFYTDSNGWLTMERKLFHHEDYQAYFSNERYDDVDGNSYPMTAFAFIKDGNTKLSINTDRPQGVISPRKGVLWVNYDRISSDDGKWVYESTFRNEYQKFTHYISFGSATHNEERLLQDRYDHPIIAQISLLQPSDRIEAFNTDLGKWKEWAQIAGSEATKFWVRPWNDTTVTLRIQNNHDDISQKVGLFASKNSPYLTAFYGRPVTFTGIEEMSLGGNKQYGKFLEQKWNWGSVVDLSKDNEIFNKQFGQNITMRPLEIRTFRISGLRFSTNCTPPTSLSYHHRTKVFTMDTTKRKPQRTQQETLNQRNVRQFLKNGNHCDGKSVVLLDQATIDQRISAPPAPNGKTQRNPELILSLAQRYPQKLPKDINKDKYYSILDTIYTQPCKIQITQPAIVSPIADPPQQTQIDTGEDIMDIKKKIVMWQPLSKEEKQKYFEFRLQQVQAKLPKSQNL